MAHFKKAHTQLKFEELHIITVLYTEHSSPVIPSGAILLPRDIWQCLLAFLVVTTRGMLLAPSG